MGEFFEIDPNFKNEVTSRPGGERMLNCYLCGTCSAGCPISELDPGFDPRRIMRRILAGMKDSVLGDGEIWKCYQCHTCVAHCPQDARFADVVRALREMSVEQGYFKAAFAEKAESETKEFRKRLLARVNELLKATDGSK